MAIQYEQLASTPESMSNTDPLFAGGFPRAEKAITIVTGQVAMTRGTILISSSSKAAKYAGSGTIIGILGDDTAAAAGDIPTFMYVTGEFNQDLLVGLDTAARTALEAMNIYPKRVD